MKKTSTRLAALGGLVILGACALALAQHDSRNREREPLAVAAFAREQAEPIPVADDWADPLSFDQHIVRYNNDGAEEYTQADVSDRNPLREAMAGRSAVTDSTEPISEPSQDLPALPSFPRIPSGNESSTSPAGASTSPAGPQGASVRLADTAYDAEASQKKVQSPASEPSVPARLVGGPNKPPAWLNSGNLPSTSQASQAAGQLPVSGAEALPGTSTGEAGKQESPRPKSPQRPTADTQAQPTAEPALPTEANVGYPGIPRGSRPNQDLSDTQRAAMPPTRLLGTPIPSGPSDDPRPAQAPRSNPQSPAPGSSGAGATLPGNPAASPGLPNVPSLGNRSSTNSPSLPIDAAPTGSYSGAATSREMPPGNASSASSRSERPTGVLGSLVSNQPGGRHLDGSQKPILMIEKRAPNEIQVGKPATFVITVQNAGSSTAHDVTVLDRIPRGVRFAESIPAIRPSADGLLEWRIGELAAGATTTISLKLVPEVEGEVGSVATVQFAAQASVRTVATQPKLELLLESLPDVLIGDNHQVVVTLRNVGTGMAKAVRLQADIPKLLKHESGDAELEAPVGDLRPNESKRIPLAVAAIQPGQAVYAIRAVTDDGVMNEKSVNVEVRSPQLVAAIEGPKLRYLERQATYRIAVQNTGTAAATNVDFVVHLPAGLKFNSASTAGMYDPNTHAVTWGLHELNAGQTAPLEVTVLPVELGAQVITFGAKADLGITAEAKQQVAVEGHAELLFTIGQDNGTIEVGASSTYSVQVTNVGNKPDKNVQLAIELPAGTKLLRVDAPVEYQASDRQIVFAPVAEMRKRDQYTFSFQVQHDQPGTQLVRAKLTSGNWPQAVVKEEGTLVYNDQR